jgi:hypothetical protein
VAARTFAGKQSRRPLANAQTVALDETLSGRL